MFTLHVTQSLSFVSFSYPVLYINVNKFSLLFGLPTPHPHNQHTWNRFHLCNITVFFLFFVSVDHRFLVFPTSIFLASNNTNRKKVRLSFLSFFLSLFLSFSLFLFPATSIIDTLITITIIIIKTKLSGVDPVDLSGFSWKWHLALTHTHRKRWDRHTESKRLNASSSSSLGVERSSMPRLPRDKTPFCFVSIFVLLFLFLFFGKWLNEWEAEIFLQKQEEKSRNEEKGGKARAVEREKEMTHRENVIVPLHFMRVNHAELLSGPSDDDGGNGGGYCGYGGGGSFSPLERCNGLKQRRQRRRRWENALKIEKNRNSCLSFSLVVVVFTFPTWPS